MMPDQNKPKNAARDPIENSILCEGENRARKPALEVLGFDLLRATVWERTWSLTLPFLTCLCFFVLGSHGWWAFALICAILQAFFTYASVSHDLVHRTLGLPKFLNEFLLSIIEGLSFRSGHAFRVTHLHHHQRFPSDDDLEGAAAGMTWWKALLYGVTAQQRLWLWAVRHSRGSCRKWILIEGAGVIFGIAWCLTSKVGIVYLILTIGGAWLYPFMTSFMPHDPTGSEPLRQTRLFRGKVISWLSLDHLYHLEHHLYPQVPHQRWPELAKRLDPYFEEQGIKPRVLWK